MLEINDEVFQFKLRGKLVELRIPYMEELNQYEVDLKKQEKGNEVKFIMDFLIGLGFPEGEKLQVKQMQNIIKAFAEKK